MNKSKTYYKRNLPHYQSLGYTFFVTYRLNGSLPIRVIKQLREEKEKMLKRVAEFNNRYTSNEKYKSFQFKYFTKFDKLLDRAGYGPRWLSNEKAAQVVKDVMHYYDKELYNLICHSIMSNHVHLAFTPIVKENKNVGRDSSRRKETVNFNDSDIDINVDVQFPIVTNIMRLIKGRTSRECNKILNRSGPFWQHESYDHVVRDDKELHRIIKYVLFNPVKARLCEDWEDWH